MRTLVLALSVALISPLGGDFGNVKPSFAASPVDNSHNPPPAQPSPLPNGTPRPLLPVPDSDRNVRSIEKDTSLCFFQQATGTVVNLNHLCQSDNAEPTVEVDPGAERARQMEWHGGY
jgi:hypothetical protein